MRKKLLAIVIIVMMVLTGCGETKDSKYCSSLVETGYDNLYYDTRTGIVYYVTYERMSAYYAENGLPYRFNSETGELECINS